MFPRPHMSTNDCGGGDTSGESGGGDGGLRRFINDQRVEFAYKTSY